MAGERLLRALQSALWLLLLASAWVLTLATGWGLWAARCCGFEAAGLSAWRELALAFRAGGALRFDFVMSLLATLAVGMLGLIWLVWRWSVIEGFMPDVVEPAIALAASLRLRLEPRLPDSVSRPPLTERPEPTPLAPPRTAAAPTETAPATPATPETVDDSGVARLLALTEIWQSPAAAWMQEALNDEVRALPDSAWPKIEQLGAASLPLLTLLLDQGLIPDRPDIGRMITKLSAIQPSEDGLDMIAAPPPLTLGAAWLCELIESHLLRRADRSPAGSTDLGLDALLSRALRSMTEADWASLDRFPERAGRIRVLSDQLREDLRHSAAPVSPIALVERLLHQFGFCRLPSGDAEAAGPLLAARDDLLLLLSLPPNDPRGWPHSGGLTGDPHYRVLWQRLALARLRQPARRVSGLLVLPPGLAIDHAALVRADEAQRSRTGIILAWLEDGGGVLPSLSGALANLSAAPARPRPDAAATARAALQP